METTIIGYIRWGFIGIMEKKMETTILGYILGFYRDNGYVGLSGVLQDYIELYRVLYGHMGIMEKKMETTVVYSHGHRV